MIKEIYFYLKMYLNIVYDDIEKMMRYKKDHQYVSKSLNVLKYKTI